MVGARIAVNMHVLYRDSEDVVLTGARWRTCVRVARFPASVAGASGRFILVHGNPSNLSHWVNTVDALCLLGEVIVFDSPGFGRSEALPASLMTLDGFSEVVVALADVAGWGRADLVGQSHGGMVVQTVAGRFPGRVRSLVLLATGGVPTHLSYRLLSLPGVKALLGDRGAGALSRSLRLRPLVELVHHMSAKGIFAPDPVPDGFVESEVEELARVPETLLSMGQIAMNGPCEQLANQAKHVVAPTLFVHGEQDALVPIAYARRVFDLMEHAASREFCALAGGHMIHMAQSERVNTVMSRWLRAVIQS